MSLSHALSFATSGLTANARRAELISSNVANAMTEGYGRRELAVSAQTIGNAGAGVRIDGVVRHADPQLTAARRNAGAETGYESQMQAAFRQIESLFGTSPDEPGLLQDFSRLTSALIAAEADPASTPALEIVSDSFVAIATALSRGTETMQSARSLADSQIDTLVSALSADLEQVSVLNRSIQRAVFSGAETSSLIDQREKVLDRVSDIVPFQLLTREDGQVALLSRGGVLLVDATAADISFETTPLITAGMDAEAGVPRPLLLGGQSFDLAAITGRLGGGSLAAAFEMRDAVFVEGQARLDSFAAALLQRLEDPALDPSNGVSNPGILTDAGASFDPANVVGLAGRLQLNAALDPDAGGATWRLREGIGATTQAASGDGRLFARLRGSLGLGFAGGVAHQTTLYDSLSLDAARSAKSRVRAEDRQIAAQALFASLREAEAAKGVDTDYELQLLMQVEQAFAANAKVIEVAGTLMQQLLEI